MLTALRPSGGAARVHQEQRFLGQHLNRVDLAAPETRQHLIHDEVAARNQWRWTRISARVPLPYEHLLDFHALLFRLVDGDVRFLFVIEKLAAAVIGVHRDQHRALGVDDAVRCGLATEAAEDLRMNDPEPGAGEHRDRKLRHHRHVQRNSVAFLQTAEVSQQRGDLIHAHGKFLVGDVLDSFLLRLGNEVDRGLVLVFSEMAIDAVVTGVDSAADEPSPERRIARVERDVPGLVPVEKIGVLLEAVREVVETESFKDRLVGQVGLNNEFLWRVNVGLFLPVDRDLCLRRFCGSLL